jgi:hypothetical protein
MRNGTTSLFGALDVATGKVLASFHRRQRHQEFLRFLEGVDEAVPEALDIHLVMDNYGTHKMPKVKRWFASASAACARVFKSTAADRFRSKIAITLSSSARYRPSCN